MSISKKTHTKCRPIQRKSQDAPQSLFPRRARQAYLITAGVGAALLLIGSLCLALLPDPIPLIRPLSIATCFATALVGGIVAGKLHGGAPALCGLCNGALLLTTLLLLSLFFRSLGNGYSAWLSAGLHLSVLLLSLAGALLGIRKPAPLGRRRKKR